MSPRSRIETPFADWPAIAATPAGDGFHLSGRYTAPSGLWSVGFPALLLMFWLPVTIGSCSLTIRDLASASTGEIWTPPVLTTVVFVALGIAGGVFGRRRTVDVTLARGTIEIDGTRYQRAEGLNQFAIEEHEGAHGERQRNASPIYRDAVQVVMRYGERRIVIAAFRKEDVRKAEALLARLQHVNKHLEDMLGERAPGAAPSADDFGAARPIR
jgi:hypothetical protein